MQTAKRNNQTAIVVKVILPTSCCVELNSLNDIACLLSSTSVHDYIDAKPKETVKRLKSKVTNKSMQRVTISRHS